MTRIKCWIRECEYNSLTEDLCLKDAIEIDENGCEDMILHTEAAKEYRTPYYKQLRSRKDRHRCRKQGYGKRIERFGLVFYTEDDDRYGEEEIRVTEESSGYYCGKLADLNEERIAMIREKLKTILPVADLPDATDDDL